VIADFNRLVRPGHQAGNNLIIVTCTTIYIAASVLPTLALTSFSAHTLLKEPHEGQTWTSATASPGKNGKRPNHLTPPPNEPLQKLPSLELEFLPALPLFVP